MESVPLLNGFLALIALGAAIYSGRAWPIGVRSRVQVLTERVEAAEANVEAVAGKWAAKHAELEAVAEEIEGMLSSIETKRRRIAAAESRKASNGPTPPADRHAELLRAARQQGHQV